MADQQASSSTTAAPAGGAATESTPLLQATSTDDPSPAPAPPSSPEATSNTGVDKFTYVLITASVFLGPITIALALAMLVVLTASPGGDEFSMSYRLREAWVGITGIALVTTALSSVNFARQRRSLRPLPAVINAIFDGVAGTYLCLLALEPTNYGLDVGYCYSRVEGKREQCEQFRRGFGVLVLAFVLGGICLGLCHLILLVLRLVKAFRSRRLEGGRLYIPTGQLTFEFTIKLLRQESAVREPAAAGSATAARATVEEETV